MIRYGKLKNALVIRFISRLQKRFRLTENNEKMLVFLFLNQLDRFIDHLIYYTYSEAIGGPVNKSRVSIKDALEYLRLRSERFYNLSDNAIVAQIIQEVAADSNHEIEQLVAGEKGRKELQQLLKNTASDRE